jgi:hypothetical protein
MRNAAALLLAGCASLAVREHRELWPEEREAIEAACARIRAAGFLEHARLISEIHARGGVRMGLNMVYPETYEEVYWGPVTIDSWIFVRPDLMRRAREGDLVELAGWLVHAAGHGLGAEEQECEAARAEFERRSRRP